MSQAMYDTTALITRIRSLYDEPDSANSYISDAEIVYLLNQAQIDITARHNVAPYDSGTISGASFSADKEYTFASTQTVVAVERVHVDGNAIPRIPYLPYDQGAALDHGFYLRGNTIGIPTIQSGNNVRIYGRGQLTELTNSTSSTPALPVVYVNALVDKTLAYMYAKEKDYNASGFWEQAYERDIARAGASSAKGQLPDRVTCVV